MKIKRIYLILGIFLIILGSVTYYYFDLFSIQKNNSVNNKDNIKNDNYNNDDSIDNNDNNSVNINDNIIDDYINNNDSTITEDNYFKEIILDDFVSLINNKQDFILVISQTWCSHCTSYKPKVEYVANNNKVIIYYMEYNMLSDDDKNIFNNYVNFSGTPTTVFFKNGVELIDLKIADDTSVNNLENILIDNGYIK